MNLDGSGILLSLSTSGEKISQIYFWLNFLLWLNFSPVLIRKHDETRLHIEVNVKITDSKYRLGTEGKV